MKRPSVLAIDPGRRKCGLAVVDEAEACLAVEVVPLEALCEALRRLVAAHAPAELVLGNGTGHGEVSRRIRESLGSSLPLRIEEERFTTLEARELYFRRNPPRGWRRLLPRFLLLPDELDGWAAAVLALRRIRRPLEPDA